LNDTNSKSTVEHLEELIDIPNVDKVWYLSTRKFLLSPKVKQFNRLNIIDIFDGYEPYLIDRDYFEKGINQVGLLPTFVLDSNVVGSLHQLFNKKNINESDKKSLLNFIDNLIIDDGSNRFYDINPIFYILECLLKDVADNYIIDNLASIILLQSLDLKAFKKNNMNFQKDMSLENEYLSKYGTFNLNEVSRIMFKSIKSTKQEIQSFKKSVDLTYLFLLKIAQIDIYETKLTVLQKIKTVKKFYLDSIGVFSAREINIAIYYFHSTIGGFIPTKQKTYKVVLETIYNSALDISLLRFTETMLSQGKRELTAIVYPVTFEQHVSKIGQDLTLSMQSVLKSGEFYSLFKTTLSLIEKSKDLNNIINDTNGLSEHDIIERFNTRSKLNNLLIEQLIKDIELSIMQVKT